MRYYPHKTFFSTKIGRGCAKIDYARTTETIRYQYDNHLGSSSLELDEDANIISYEEYHPFGTTSYRSGRSETEVSLKRYKYVGKERDEETGLYYYGARYYAAWLGRWTSVDPMAEKYPSVSPYCYTLNNPVRYTDPNGMEPEDDLINQVLLTQNLKQGYEVCHNNETDVTMIIKTSAQWHPNKTSPIGKGTANIQVNQTTYMVGGDGKLSDVSVSILGMEASISEKTGILGGTNYNIDNVKTTNEKYNFADKNHNADQLEGYATDPIVSGVSAIKQNSNYSGGNALSNQNFKLPGLHLRDRLQSSIPTIIKVVSLLGKNTQTIGIEDAVNWNFDNKTWLSIPQNKVKRAADRLQNFSHIKPIIIN